MSAIGSDGDPTAAKERSLVLIHRQSQVNASYVQDSFRKFVQLFELDLVDLDIDFVMVGGKSISPYI